MDKLEKLEKCIKDCFMEEAQELENEIKNEMIETPDEHGKKRILQKIIQNVEI